MELLASRINNGIEMTSKFHSKVSSPFFQIVGAIVVIALSYLSLKWRSSTLRRLKHLSEKASLLRVVRKRGKKHKVPPLKDAFAPELELRSNYEAELRSMIRFDGVSKFGDDVNLITLNEYLASLEPKGALSCIQEELDVLLGTALLRVLGSQLGGYFLPILGVLTKVAAKKFGFAPDPNASAEVGPGLLANLLQRQESAAVAGTTIGVPGSAVKMLRGTSLLFMQGVADVAVMVMHEVKNFQKKYAKKEEKEKQSLDPIASMKRGEAYDRSFSSEAIPNPFILTEHWNAAIHDMELQLYPAPFSDGEKPRVADDYDPDAHPFNVPTPVGEALLPDLHFGFGGVKSTHSHRQIIQNRLVNTLFNRLASNDLKLINEQEKTVKTFVVQMDPNGEPLMRVETFAEALLKSGHTLEACGRTRTTTFGIGFCVRDHEDEDENERWLQIPLGVCLRTGLEDSKGKSIPTFLTHGGLDLEIRGPIVRASVQHYQAIEGFCGWMSNNYWDLPWLFQPVNCGPVYKNEGALRPLRMSALSAVSANTIASRMAFPFGGYGLMGVCNDNVALIQQAVTNTTNVFPLIGIGRFQLHFNRVAKELYVALKKDPATDPKVVADAGRLVEALFELPNDVHTPPYAMINKAERALHCTADGTPFRLMVEGNEMLKSILEELKSMKNLEK